MKRLLYIFLLVFALQQIYAQQKGNTCETAIPYEINADPIGGIISNGETWWYVFTLAADYQNVEIRTCLSTADASCIVDLYSDCSTFITGGEPNTCNTGNPNEMISLPVLPAGFYHVSVTGGGLSNGAYSLEIIGTTDAVFDDLSVDSIVKPVKNFSNEMLVTVSITNSGLNSQTAFPVSLTFDGNTYTETCPLVIESGETAQYTFLQTIDLSTEGIYDISAKTELSNDENTENDEFITQINNYVNDNALFFLYTDYISVPDNEAFNFTNNFTVEAWFYEHSTKSSGKVLSKHANDGTDKSGYAIESDGTNINAVIGTGANWTIVSAPVNDDQWYHVAMVYNSGTLEMFLNGVSQGTAVGTILTNNMDLYIGASQQYGNAWTGYIDEVRIWNTARTEQEIQDNMNIEVDPQSVGLVAYYDFNRGIPEGNNTAIEYLPDMTDNNFHGKLNNFTLSAGISDHNFFSTCDLDLKNPVPDNEILDVITGECSADVTYTPTATDNCAGAITGTTSDPLSYTEQGNYTVTWSYDDGNGHLFTQAQNVIVEDVTNPTITCIENETRNLSQGETFYTVTGTEFDPVSNNDNCEIASIINDFNSTETLANAELPIGTTTITWTVEDNAGNVNTCSFDVIVNAYISINNISRNDISVYPNPTTDYITVKSDELKKGSIEITDMTGKKLYNSNFADGNYTIDVSTFENGVYFIKIKSEEIVLTQKIIKK